MEYFITFLEGLISFVSPCMLPMIPVYVSYFAGDADKKRSVFLNALSFVTGFTLVFVSVGFFAGTIGSFVSKFQTEVNIICGALVVLFGLSYLGVIHIPFFKLHHKSKKITGLFSSFVFGLIFSVSHTPCIGVFLGSALALAADSSGALKGVMLLLSYSLGMGLPFLISTILIGRLSGLLKGVTKHHKLIRIICGLFLIIVGISMMTGLLHQLIHCVGGCSDEHHIIPAI